MSSEKARLHPRNKNRERYDLNALSLAIPELKKYIKPNKSGMDSVDFSNPTAVKLLNKAILNLYYDIQFWEFPDENLCPPIPGRADYIHYMADLLAEENFGKIPVGGHITCFDIGMGASCIYPIIGATEYHWTFIGSDIDLASIQASQKIASSNFSLKDKIDCKLQNDPNHFFKGIINKEDRIDISFCNPPFHASIEEAQKGTRRKIKNLSGKKNPKLQLNFSGRKNELIYEGGEITFIRKMIQESKSYAKNIYWFSTLVSKESNLEKIYKSLKKIKAEQFKTIPMGTSNKSTRIVAWTFLTKKEKKEWREGRWKEAEKTKK